MSVKTLMTLKPQIFSPVNLSNLRYVHTNMAMGSKSTEHKVILHRKQLMIICLFNTNGCFPSQSVDSFLSDVPIIC